MFKTIPTNLLIQPHSYSLQRFYLLPINLISLTPPPLFAILVTLLSAFPRIFQPHTIFLKHPPYGHKLLTNKMNHPKRK